MPVRFSKLILNLKITEMKKPNLYISFVVLLLLSTACSRNTTAIKQSTLALSMAEQSQKSALEMLDKVSAQSKAAKEMENIDSSTNHQIQNYVLEQSTAIETVLKELENAHQDIDSYKGKRGDKDEKEVIAEANKIISRSSDLVRILEKKTEVIVDFLGSETFSKSEIGALFKPGEYQLIKEQIKEGQKLFRPIVEKLFVFSGKYKDAFSSLKGEIIVTGYSDATAIEKGSGLYRDLAKKLQRDDAVEVPSNQDLNQKLSELRASAVRDLLEKIIADRKKANPELIDINVRILGRGELIPKGLEENVAANDRRRRVVTFYWVVLPNL